MSQTSQLPNNLIKRALEMLKRTKERHDLDHILREISKLPIEIEKILDIGAHEGEFANKVRKVFPDARILMVEPNTNINFPTYLGTLVNEVLSDSIKEVNFFSTGNTGDSYFPEKQYTLNSINSTTRTTTTVDFLLEQFPIFKSPDLIKLDTQGSEVDIMKGAEAALKYAKIVICEIPIIEYNRGAPTFDNYMNCLFDFDFVPWRVSEIITRKNIAVQLDMVFLSKKSHAAVFGESSVSRIIW